MQNESIESESTPQCPPHHIRVAEANGEEYHEGYCLKGCGFTKLYKAWSDPYENLEAGDYAHALIYGYTRPGTEE